MVPTDSITRCRLALLFLAWLAVPLRAATWDVRVAATIVKGDHDGERRIRVRLTNLTREEIAVSVPMLCSYRYSVLRSGTPVRSERNPAAVEVPTQVRGSEVNCGAAADPDRYFTRRARLLLPAGKSLSYDEPLVQDAETDFRWASDDVIFLFHVPATAFAGKRRTHLRVPPSVTASVDAPPPPLPPP